ncbi:MAG: hypothetical protein HQL17_04535 [Candidatus Omnitrophica bacterium]|nr:hypothetical protein [Candidatus Omnitrophota bacterium]
MSGNFFSYKIKEVSTVIRFVLGLRRFLSEKAFIATAKRVLEQRKGSREESFLMVVKKGIFGYAQSPYLPLFRLAGITYEGVERMVAEKGLEGALMALKDAGVYFTIEEFKGRKPVVRQGTTFAVSDRDFDNPYMASSYQRRSGGTRSVCTRVEMNFDFLAEIGATRALILDVEGLADAAHVILRPVNPYGVGMMYMLQLVKYGIYPARWVSLVREKDLGLSLRSWMGVRAVFLLATLFGKKLPMPEFLNSKDIADVVRGLAKLLVTHQKCGVSANVSMAVRVCLVAKRLGVDLTGVEFHGCGEPLTAAKKKAVEAVGARVVLYYAFAEVGLAGSLCSRPAQIDDIHVFNDFVVLTSYKREAQGCVVDALLATTLLPSAPKIFLNVESGDYGVLEERKCGCPYDGLGYHQHIHHIRSFEKLTGEGMTFYGADLLRIVEELLPAAFGGSCLDYQLVEEEGAEGLTRLMVHVSPRVGPVDEVALVKALIYELKKGNDSQKVMAQVWLEAGTVQVRRKDPVLTKDGKQYPLHIIKEAG